MFKTADLVLFGGIGLFFVALLFGMRALQSRMPAEGRARMEEMGRMNAAELELLEAQQRAREREEKVRVMEEALRRAAQK